MFTTRLTIEGVVTTYYDTAECGKSLTLTACY